MFLYLLDKYLNLHYIIHFSLVYLEIRQLDYIPNQCHL